MKYFTAAQAFSQTIKNLHILLKPLGFKKKGNHFYRYIKHGVGQLIHTQKSRWSDKSRISFTFNIGLVCPPLQYDPRFQEAGQPLPDFPNILDCLAQERIGFLLPEPGQQDIWFEVADGANNAAVLQEVQTIVETFVLLHFAAHSVPQQLYPLIGNRHAMQLAAKLGEPEQAQRFYRAEREWAQQRYHEECQAAKHFQPGDDEYYEDEDGCIVFGGEQPDPQVWLDYLSELERDAARWGVLT
ncbi:DUF4304 domain-containing protein [Eikenella corrodens]|jgi:hypothetical protein|uniref:DUF4304 domain-containing protein n=1 Tax=Eikenella corrodens TaxID=539 RepID=UPI00129BDEB3|nr:DUF4304 domain-containing protein [Eikenella corrodens]